MADIDDIFNRALEHHLAGRLHEASTLYQQVLAARPTHARSLHLLGAIAYQLGRGDLAATLIEGAIGIDETAPAFHNDLGEVYRSLGRRQDAAEAFAKALALAPDMASATNNLGLLMHAEGQLHAAIGFYHRASTLMPDSADMKMNLGCALLEAGAVEPGVAALEAAHALAPANPVVALNLGNARMAQDRPEDAAALYGAALGQRPDYALAEVNLGRALQELGRPAEALGHYEHAASLDPTLAAARWNEGLCRLLLGDFERGWEGFARRWDAGSVPPHGLDAPVWDGSGLDGKRLLVHAEAGLGDTIQFARFLPLLRPFGAATVTLLCQPPLRRLLAASGIDVATPDEPLPPHDLRVPLLDLPRLLKTIPADVPYLTPGPDAIRPELPAHGVGLVWQGRREHANDRHRSIDPALLAPLLAVPGIAWVSLQKDAPAPAGTLDLAPALDDMADTAAAIAGLDLVIAVDTAVAHLAGALGKPVWILLPFAPDWRWQTGRTDSPWYPTARLFRQPARGDWASVVAEVAAALSYGASRPAG